MATATSTLRRQVQHELDQIPSQHFPSLLKMLRDFRESVSVPSAEECFQQAWKEALNGQTRPISELWERLDAE